MKNDNSEVERCNPKLKNKKQLKKQANKAIISVMELKSTFSFAIEHTVGTKTSV